MSRERPGVPPYAAEEEMMESMTKSPRMRCKNCKIDRPLVRDHEHGCHGNKTHEFVMMHDEMRQSMALDAVRAEAAKHGVYFSDDDVAAMLKHGSVSMSYAAFRHMCDTVTDLRKKLAELEQRLADLNEPG